MESRDKIRPDCTGHFINIPTPYKVKEAGLFVVPSRRTIPQPDVVVEDGSKEVGLFCKDEDK